MCLILYIGVLFISHMESVTGSKFLNTTSLSPLFGLFLASALIDIVPLTNMYVSLSHINLALALTF